ncbi:MAG: hypothetical protein AB1298_08005 [Bacteroidota bacterium]
MKLTPLKAIKKHCLECSGYNLPAERTSSFVRQAGKKEVRECKITDCVLFPYRLGSNPNRKGCTNPKNAASTTGFENADGYVSAS